MIPAWARRVFKTTQYRSACLSRASTLAAEALRNSAGYDPTWVDSRSGIVGRR